MPMYEYVCRACGERFEEFRRLDEGGASLECPKCGSGEAEKQLSAFATASSGAPKTGTSPGGSSCGPRGFG